MTKQDFVDAVADRAGISKREAGAATTADASRSTTSASSGDGRVGDSGISGVVTWSESGRAPEIKRRMQLHLIALPGQQSVQEQRFTVRCFKRCHALG